ncbi:GDSL esterase/lipase At5g33370-like [Zingiber officinale]|uniref:GDSL esterase/lipase At5g33370-like n=1 Tax=Zingiber officinale TaxID=94328 RepID=UPI001C4C8B1F|nr:GDSL esterase/lipase At5g33370-like [Zingiber officinale]
MAQRIAAGVLFLALASLPALSAAARAFFVFGDSLVDNGNNNFLATTARADQPPYGIDTPSRRPTGRFSNGKNVPDIVSEYIGSEPTLPYLSPELQGERLLVGANFASAGIGILNDTGFQFANIIRITKQLQYFEQYQQRLSSVVGQPAAKRLVNDALVLITLGGNDFVNNYYLVPYSLRSRQFSLPDYVRYLISEYKKILTRLYELGSRRVLVTGVGPLGCVPAELGLRSLTGRCDPELQRVPDLYNPQMIALLGDLNAQFGADVFVAVNAYKMHMDFITNPQSFGFVTSKIACCGQGPYNGIGLCTILSNLCPNRDIYAFWDAFHPTERANRIIVSQFMAGTNEYMNPMNLSSILAMDTRT